MEYSEHTLGELCIGSKGRYGIGASAEPYGTTKYTYLRITDINDDGTLNTADLKSLNDPDAEKYLLSPGDIVFARTGASTGRSYYYEGTIPNMVFAGFLIKFTPDETKVYPRFLKYYCISNTYRNWINGAITGSTRGNINEQTLRNMPVVLPDLETQKKIVRILSSLDQKAKLNSQNNKTLNEIAEALFKKQFAAKIYGDKTISDYILPKRGKPLLSKDAREGSVPVVAGGLEPATYHNQSNTMDPVITISASGANAGFTRLWGEKVWSSDSSYIDSSITDNIYFWYVFLKTRQKEIYDAQTGSAQAHIYPKHIGDMSIGFIDNEKIIEYNKRVKPLFEKIFKNEFENKTLLSLRDTILPKLLSGEINIDKVMLHE